MKLQTRDTRFWLIGGVALGLVVALAGWLLVISPQRNSAATLRTQAADANAENVTITAQVAALARLGRDPAQLTAALRRVLLALPSDSGLSAFTRQVTTQASANHLTLASIAVGGFAMPAADPAAVADPAAGTDGTDGTAPVAAGATATTAGVPSGIVSIPITLISDGAAADQLAFLRALRVTGPRSALVTSTALTVPATVGAGSIDAACTMTVTLTVYSAVRSPAEQAELTKLLRG